MRFMLTLVVAVVLTATLATAQTVGPITVPTPKMVVETDAYTSVTVLPPAPGTSQAGVIVPIETAVDPTHVAPAPAGVSRTLWCDGFAPQLNRPKSNMVHLDLSAVPVASRQIFVDAAARITAIYMGRVQVTLGKAGPGATFPVTIVPGLIYPGRDGSVLTAGGLTTPFVNPVTGEIVAGTIQINPDYLADGKTVLHEVARAASGFGGNNPNPGLLAGLGRILTAEPSDEERILLLRRLEIPLLSRCQQ